MRVSWRAGATCVACASLVLAGGCPPKDDGTDQPETDVSDTEVPDPVPNWEPAFDTAATGALSGVWGAAADDIFVVGGHPDRGEVYHYDGATWSPMTVPEGVGLLVWVYGFGPDDVWSVGVDGGFVHYDGTAWTALESGTTEDLWGIFGFANDDLWIVGGDPDLHGNCGDETKTCMWHWDGTTLSDADITPEANTRGATSLFKVWGLGDTLFAVGQRGLVLRHGEGGWTPVSAGEKADQDFVSLSGTAEDRMVAVGGRGNGRIATWDGSTWSTIAPTGRGGLNAVSMERSDRAIVGGIYGFVGAFYPDSGELVPEAELTDKDIHAIWYDGEGRHYAVGGRFFAPYTGVAFVRTEEAP